MNNAKVYMQYTEQVGFTSTPGELLIMLFNAELKNIKIAIINIKSGSIADAHMRLIKAQEIIDELILSLNDTYEISRELTSIYSFIKNELVTANIKKDVEKLEQLIPIITELRDTWEKANRLAKVK